MFGTGNEFYSFFHRNEMEQMKFEFFSFKNFCVCFCYLLCWCVFDMHLYQIKTHSMMMSESKKMLYRIIWIIFLGGSKCELDWTKWKIEKQTTIFQNPNRIVSKLNYSEWFAAMVNADYSFSYMCCLIWDGMQDKSKLILNSEITKCTKREIF